VTIRVLIEYTFECGHKQAQHKDTNPNANFVAWFQRGSVPVYDNWCLKCNEGRIPTTIAYKLLARNIKEIRELEKVRGIKRA